MPLLVGFQATTLIDDQSIKQGKYQFSNDRHPDDEEKTIIAVPLYRRSRPQGVSGAGCGKASYYSALTPERVI